MSSNQNSHGTYTCTLDSPCNNVLSSNSGMEERLQGTCYIVNLYWSTVHTCITLVQVPFQRGGFPIAQTWKSGVPEMGEQLCVKNFLNTIGFLFEVRLVYHYTFGNKMEFLYWKVGYEFLLYLFTTVKVLYIIQIIE